jgi:hypothetical protein
MELKCSGYVKALLVFSQAVPPLEKTPKYILRGS